MTEIPVVQTLVSMVERLLGLRSQERQRAEQHLIAANQALLTLRYYWRAIMKYGQNQNRLLESTGTDISDTGLKFTELGFIFSDQPELMTRLHDTENLCRATIRRINRFDALRPGGEDFSRDSLGEFNSIQSPMHADMIKAIPALVADTRDFHSACESALGRGKEKKLISIEYLKLQG